MSPAFPVVLLPPDDDRLLALTKSMHDVAYSYPPDLVGGTWASDLPEGWFADDTTKPIGQGLRAFERGVAALHRWTQFDLGWVTPMSTTVPIVEGQLFAFTSRQIAVWSVNVCRIVRVVDDHEGPIRRFGFSYGTLDRHAVRGEERFLLTYDERTDEVAFGIRKFSMPAHWLLWATLPLVRYVQERFTHEAIARIAREVE
ncbi:MAG: DUF1990 domain-containing protein [Myxococcota bacterium]